MIEKNTSAISLSSLGKAFVEYVRKYEETPDALVVAPEGYTMGYNVVTAREIDNSEFVIMNPHFLSLFPFLDCSLAEGEWYLARAEELPETVIKLPVYGEGSWYQM